MYVWLKGKLDSETSQGKFLIRANFYDASGSYLSRSDLTAMNPGAVSSWTRVGGRVTAPANSVSMQVQYLLYMSSGWVNLDDVEVTPVAPASTTEVTKYYYFGGQRVAMRKNGVLTYLHADHLGSTVLETNASGVVTSDEKYKAYGKQRDTGTVSTDHRFTGQKEDASGLQYFAARYYDPSIGTFVSPDTIVPDAGNVFDYDRYMYVRGNAINAVDPTGHFTEQEVMDSLSAIYGNDEAKRIFDLWMKWDQGWMDILLNPNTISGTGIWASELGYGTFIKTEGTPVINIAWHTGEYADSVQLLYTGQGGGGYQARFSDSQVTKDYGTRARSQLGGVVTQGLFKYDGSSGIVGAEPYAFRQVQFFRGHNWLWTEPLMQKGASALASGVQVEANVTKALWVETMSTSEAVLMNVASLESHVGPGFTLWGIYKTVENNVNPLQVAVVTYYTPPSQFSYGLR